MNPYTLPGPENIQRTRLPNGIEVLTRENHHSPAVYLSGYFPGGSIFDPPGKEGLANLTALALMRGTERQSFDEIFASLENVGASLGFSAAVHTVAFNGRALAEDLPLLFALLSDVLRRPVFSPQPLKQLHTQLMAGFALREQDTYDMAAMAFDRLIYGRQHPYGWPVSGWKETVAPLQRQDLQDFHARHYGPRGMVLAVTGDITHEQVLRVLEDHLADWENPAQPAMPDLPPVPPVDAPRREHIDIPDKVQIDLFLGCLGPARRDDDFLLATLANSALGQFGMMGRIGHAVRRRNGLAYYASSDLEGGVGPGTWYVNAGVSPENFDSVIHLVKDEIGRFVDEGVRSDELRDIKSGIISSMPFAFESNAGMLSALLGLVRYDWPLDYYRTYASRIQAVSVEAVNAVIRRYWHPDKLVLTSAGELGQL